MGVEFGPDFGKALFEELGQALVDAALAILGNVDGLAEGEEAVARNVFRVAAHGGVGMGWGCCLVWGGIVQCKCKCGAGQGKKKKNK